MLKDFLLQDMVEVKVTEAMWNRTGGLCGLMDGHMTNDLEAEHDSIVSYANRWQANLPTGGCDRLSSDKAVTKLLVRGHQLMRIKYCEQSE